MLRARLAAGSIGARPGWVWVGLCRVDTDPSGKGDWAGGAQLGSEGTPGFLSEPPEAHGDQGATPNAPRCTEAAEGPSGTCSPDDRLSIPSLLPHDRSLGRSLLR